jgi:molybdopterin-guanine dinucleotide biosynthesis protein A
MKADTGRAGIVLAGGRSTRFGGEDKALAPLAGTPLLRHAVRGVAPAVDSLLVSCRAEQVERLEAVLDGIGGPDVAFVADPITDLGPVAGLRTALRETDRLSAVVTACDMPLVPSAFLGHLLDRVETSTTAGVVTRVDGHLQSFPVGVNVRAATAACTEALDSGGDLRDALDSLAPVVIPERDVRASVGHDRLVDVDTRADLARAERSLARTTATTGGSDRPSRTDEVRSDGR